jgi:hypothetical protein
VSAYVLRIVFGVYLAVGVLLLVKAASQAAFGRQAGWGNRLLKAALLAPFWPVAIFSAQGRGALRAVFFYNGGVEP